MKTPSNHPRAESIGIRNRLVEQYNMGVVAQAGLIAHGRGEAFDYLLGERTTEPALEAIRAAASTLLTATYPVVSVNGNAAALAASDIVKLSEITQAQIEVNLFHRSVQRERAIENLLKLAGATRILGVGGAASARISEIGSERRRVDPEGILKADVILVPLEDGDRAEALVRMRKKVIAVDLNPMSRTAQLATITIVDNITRAMPTLVRIADEMRIEEDEKLRETISNFDNKGNLGKAIAMINQRLLKIAESGAYISVLEKRKI
ncbi:MAG: phosphopantothenate/pantothenate synthetase [Candidatus Bathyarchaeota archaeon]|nr:MAG: phosphopantothenate/pantothenate synthetase [Candidatus Bathyarchaeota archaeon]